MNKHRDIPVITSAKPTASSESFARKKKYLGLMSIRIPALLLSVLIYEGTHKTWLALLIIAISVPIPWIAVLIANDRPPQQKLSLFTILGISPKTANNRAEPSPPVHESIIIDNLDIHK